MKGAYAYQTLLQYFPVVFSYLNFSRTNSSRGGVFMQGLSREISPAWL